MASPSHLLIPRLFRPSPPPLAPLSLFLSTATTTLSLHLHSSSLPLSSFLPRCRLFSNSISAAAPFSRSLSHDVVSAPCSLPLRLDSVGELGLEDSGEEGIEDDVVDETNADKTDVDGGESAARVLSPVGKRNLPELTVKEKKELASYAHSLGDKLKSQQVGKSGVTDNVVMALNETLEANELLKLKIHRTCPGELDDVVKQLEQHTGSVTVAQIGRTVIFYRPSISKLKVEEKKKQTRKAFAQKKLETRPGIQRREQGSKESVRGYRGSKRFLSSSRSDQ